MDTKVSYREIDIENSQTAPKTASTLFFPGMWVWIDPSTGFLAPLTPTNPVAGLNLTPVPASDATNALITFDGVNSTEDRFVMPVAISLAYSGLTGTFTVGETITGGTSGATGIIIADSGSVLVVVGVVGTFVTGETVTGATSGATATLGVLTVLPSPALGSNADVAVDFTSLDAATVGSGTQFVITKVISPYLVEVAVVLLQL